MKTLSNQVIYHLLPRNEIMANEKIRNSQLNVKIIQEFKNHFTKNKKEN